MDLFEGLLIALDLGYNVNFKKKSEVKKKVLENGGTVSYIVTKKCNFVVSSSPEKCDVSSKCCMAVKYKLPVVKLNYIWDCIEAKLLLPYDLYVIGGKSKILDFKSGKISAFLHNENVKKFSSKSAFNPKSVKVVTINGQLWSYEDTFEVAKYAVFTDYMSNLKCQCMTIIELHAPPAASNQTNNAQLKADKLQRETQLNYRVVLQSGSFKDLELGKTCHTEVRYVPTADQALAVFAMLYESIKRKPEMTILTGPVRAVGSVKFQKLMAEIVDVQSICDEKVKELVEHIWSEAITEVTSALGDISGIKIEQVEKAEAILVKIRDALKNESRDINELINEFYTTLPHKNNIEDSPNYRKWLARKQDMCQLIRDVISVSEMTCYETRAYVEAKYAALRCRITHLTGELRNKIEQFIKSSLERPSVDLNVVNIYEVWRQVEDFNFHHGLDEKKLLFHSSKVENFVGILSRGLLLPKVVVDDFGGIRSDVGMLGSGIYFASSASTSLKYSVPSITKGSRLLLINEVALGQIKDYTSHDTTLVVPPDGYNSTHGVSKKADKTSAFENDEFVVYSVNQQRVRYLVEFTVKGDKIKSIENINSHIANTVDYDSTEHIDINDVKGITDLLSKVEPGLICSSSSQDSVMLQAVHIRAKLVDLATQVVVLQEYHNNSGTAIEAKYVFPLEDTAAVCGFEAFINGKHIVGEVKEKETAHKEYKKAISEGHGAYLMDQDEETLDIFTVSVGNLLPGAKVLIKITYVAELQAENEKISFVLPASVAPWKEESALKQLFMDQPESHKMSSSNTTVQVAVEMPFDIKNLHSPTHKIKIKQTASKAFVEMVANQNFGTRFQLLVSLAEIHVPRMWVESHPVNKNHRACMLTFYPEFESTEVTDGEVILMLDTSNSMKGAPLLEAKKVTLLVLQNLPPGWHFNVIRFGSDYEELFPAPKLNTEENLQNATNFIQNSVANKGNTGILMPLHSLCLLPRTENQRSVFIISDGHINDQELVLRCASQSSLHTRLFSFGVSATCNSYFLKALSRVSGGAFEFFNSKTKSKWEPKVKDQISKAQQPGVTSVSVEWQQYDDNLQPPVQAPQEITALFNGSRQVVYGYVPNCTMATLKANIEGQDVSTVVSTSELSITQGLLVHCLTARAIIRDWEDGVLSKDRIKHEVAKMDMKNYIIDLSKEYSIVTQFTSFIAVEKREENEKDLHKSGPTIKELVDKENVDILNYMGWTTNPMDIDTHALPNVQDRSKNGRRHRRIIELDREREIKSEAGDDSDVSMSTNDFFFSSFIADLGQDGSNVIMPTCDVFSTCIEDLGQGADESSDNDMGYGLFDDCAVALSMPVDNLTQVFHVESDETEKLSEYLLKENTEMKKREQYDLLQLEGNVSKESAKNKQRRKKKFSPRANFADVEQVKYSLTENETSLRYSSPATYSPIAPTYSPSTPTYSPIAPTYSPSTPTYSPTSPSYCPTLQSDQQDLISTGCKSLDAEECMDTEKPLEDIKFMKQHFHVVEEAHLLPELKKSLDIDDLRSKNVMRDYAASTNSQIGRGGRVSSKYAINSKNKKIRSMKYALKDINIDTLEEGIPPASLPTPPPGASLLTLPPPPLRAAMSTRSPLEAALPPPLRAAILTLPPPPPPAAVESVQLDLEGTAVDFAIIPKPHIQSFRQSAKYQMPKPCLRPLSAKPSTYYTEDQYVPPPVLVIEAATSTLPTPLLSENFASRSLIQSPDIVIQIPAALPQPSISRQAAKIKSSDFKLKTKKVEQGDTHFVMKEKIEARYFTAPPISFHEKTNIIYATQNTKDKSSYTSLKGNDQRFGKAVQATFSSKLQDTATGYANGFTASTSFGSAEPASFAFTNNSAVFGNAAPATFQSSSASSLFGFATPALLPSFASSSLFGSAKPAQSATSTGFGGTPAHFAHSSPSAAIGSATPVPLLSSATSSLFGSAVPGSLYSQTSSLTRNESADSFKSGNEETSFSGLLAKSDSLRKATYIEEKMHILHRAAAGTAPLPCTLNQSSEIIRHKKRIDSEFYRENNSVGVSQGHSFKRMLISEDMLESDEVGSTSNCIRLQKGCLQPETLDSLISCQNKAGYWEMETNLDNLLGINIERCLAILKCKGLYSLGKSATEDIKRLVATLLALFSIMELIVPDYFPIGRPSSKEFPDSINFPFIASKLWNANMEHTGDEIVDSVRQAFEFCVKIEGRYPLAYCTLNLGTSWINVAAHFMQPFLG